MIPTELYSLLDTIQTGTPSLITPLSLVVARILFKIFIEIHKIDFYEDKLRT